jgi:nucleoside-diphosphate-sugar epimerase
MALHQDPILVTGGSGYIASWIVKMLVNDGYYVRATVRDAKNPGKVAHLLNIAAEGPGVLELVEADLLEEGSFAEGMQNCRWVIHTASPFLIGKTQNPQQQLIDPALQGTRNVLNSVNATPSVERVVLTSSVAAVVGDNSEIYQTQGEIFTEAHWNQRSSLDHQPYSYSKTLAEQEAWKMAKAQDRWQLLTINPGFVMGPSLSSRKDAASIDFMQNMLGGQLAIGAPKLNFGVVDVREVAKAHILACEKPEASGRHILVADHADILDMADLLRERLGPDNRLKKLPKGRLPKTAFYLVGPLLGFSWKYVKNNIDVPLRFDNSYSKRDLGVAYRPLGDTLAEMAQRLWQS